MTDLGSEYGRLLAERDRLIAAGVDPGELEMPLPPTGPQDYARLERYVAGPEPVRLVRDRPRYPLLTAALLVAIVALVIVLAGRLA